MSVEYSPIRVSTIKPQKELTFNLHIRFKEQFLLYLKVGEAVDRDKLKKLKKQKVARFFIDSNDEEKYQHYLDDLLDAAVVVLGLTPSHVATRAASACCRA